MKLAPAHEFNKEQKAVLAKAKFFEYITIIYLITVAGLMYIVMGSSQAMKTAWVEDVLSLVPPTMFLVTNHFRNKKPNKHFPYGFHRIISFGFFVSAIALAAVGFYLVVDSGIKIFNKEHPTIGLKEYLNQDIWLGWWMILVLVWGTIPPVILGHLKLKLAPALHNKILYTDSKMNKADWQTAVATMAGIIGLGYGYWWADGAAALFVSVSVLRDGWTQCKSGFTELMNSSPKNLEGKYINLSQKIENLISKHPDIKSAQVRMYEHGHVIFTDVFISCYESVSDFPGLTETLRTQVKNYDWRLIEATVTLENPQ